MNTATAIIAYSATEAALTDLAAKYKGVVYDVTTTDGMADAKAARNEIRAHRITLEKAREKEKAESLAYGRFVDSEAKRISDRIAELETPIAAMIDAEVNKAKLAEEAAKRAMIERAAAEEAARKRIEEELLQAQRAEIARQQAELAAAQRVQADAEIAAQRKIEEAHRAARLKIEAEERAARLAREEADRQARLAQQARDEVARVKAEQEAAVLKAERDKLDAERRAVEEARRKEREAQEAKEREIQRQANELNDGYAMLATFVRRFGKLDEFKAVTKAIGPYLKEVKAEVA